MATVSDSSTTQSLQQIASRWLASQPFANVMLVLQTSGIAWLAWYCVTTAMPATVQQIQNGHNEQTQQYIEDSKLQREQNREDLKLVIESYKDTLDRVQRD